MSSTKFQTKLLDEDTQLIVKHFVGEDNNLRLSDPSLQAAIFGISGVKEALLTEAKRREEECNKCD